MEHNDKAVPGREQHPEILTVVMPVRNRPELVVRALGSIAEQTCKPAELIVVDNGSTDATPAVLRQWAAANADAGFRLTLLSEQRPGASAARNRGLEAVKTPYVMFFDSDDVMEYDHLQRVTDMLRREPEAELVYWSVAFRDAEGWTSVKAACEPEHLMENVILHSVLGTQRYCIQTELLRRAGGWNESLPVWNDYELGIRLLASTPHIRAVRLAGSPRVIIDTSGTDTITGRTFKSRAAGHAKAIEAIAQLLKGNDEWLLLFRMKLAVLAGNYRREGDKCLADRTLERAMATYGAPLRRKMKLIYAVQCLAGSGGTFLAAYDQKRVWKKKANEKK
ncbi:MAG: glycosyltransferase family 2 protein [Firmicutes bacterium]|nr:glycosyltransferase family 2 protein [Bacillota bacterium]MCM1401347.1 glycosyltransferase family 2 protein [Bacteroides sp.]MCM1477300.1 glycosyltransferase family 2 protein [Bacteroides sp.]